MKKLIEALTILSKYTDTEWPTHCEHDVLTVDVDPKIVSEEDKAKLYELSFFPTEDEDGFMSYKYGSC